eukprot:gene9696-10687_t
MDKLESCADQKQSSKPFAPSSLIGASSQTVMVRDFQFSSWPQLLNDGQSMFQLDNGLHGFGRVCNEDFLPRTRRRLRTIFSNRQMGILEKAYVTSKYPDSSAKKQISRETNLPVERVQVWFQNKRTRDKKLKQDKKERRPREGCDGETQHVKASSRRQAGKSFQNIFCNQASSATNLTPDVKLLSASDSYGAVLIEEGSSNSREQTSKGSVQLQRTTPKRESPSNVIDKSCQHYLQSLGQSNISVISPSFIRYLHEQLRMSPPDGMEPLTFENQRLPSQNIPQVYDKVATCPMDETRK